MAKVEIQPVLMSGGSGTRLWPLSRRARPKQFARMFPGDTLFQQTAIRVSAGASDIEFLPPIVVASAAHADLIRDQLREIGVTGARLLLEPQGRDTAACAAAAAIMIGADSRQRLALLLPCDHVVEDTAAFHAALAQGVRAATAGRIVTLGAAPQGPDTAYGYIRAGAPADHALEVAAFHEKPDRQRAETYLAEGGFYWNAGIFLFAANTMLEEFAAHAPDILNQASQALDAGARDRDAVVLDPEAFAACRSQPLDRAIMEKTRRAAVVPVDMGWSDAGQWAAVWELSAKDPNGVAADGEVMTVESTNCLVRSDGPKVMLAGVEGLAVIVQDGMVMVTALNNANAVKILVDGLKAQERTDLL